MELHLRRQLLIAVCDSVVMQNQLASQLEADLNQASQSSHQLSGSEENSGEENFEAIGSAPRPPKKLLERLIFDPSDGNLPKQVAQWVRQTTLAEGSLPQVQVLGIEQMTRQPAITQNHFLRSLEKVDALLPRLNTSLLIWVPWPWLRTIQQSAPTFWNWRNGVFEFISDPTPVGIESLPPSSASERSPEQTSDSALTMTSLDSPTAASSTSVSSVPTAGQEIEALPLAAAQPAIAQLPTKQASPTYELAEEDDLSSLFAEETMSAQSRTIDVAHVSITAENAQRPAARHSSLATLGGLTSIVTKGVNADIEETASNINQSAERTNNASPSDTQTSSIQTSSIQTGSIQTGSIQTSSTGSTPAEQLKTAQPASSLNHHAPRSPRETPAHLENAPELAPRKPDPLAEGRAYRARIEAGEQDPDIIEAAIAAYENGIAALGEADSDWSIGLNDLGTLYWLKAQQTQDLPESVQLMTRSIERYQNALVRLQPNQNTLIGQLYSNMGAVYSMLATYQNSADYLNQAANAYQQALPTCSLESDPVEYATLHNSLGSVYWKLSHYEQVQDHLQSAIAAYRTALSGYQPDTQPLDYAAVQNNLGITHWSLAKHQDATVQLKQAIAAYRDALNYRTPDADPAACAITYNNMALAYWDLSKANAQEQPEEKAKIAQAQKNAVTAFEAALNVSRASSALNNMDSTAIYHCLGDVHDQMAATATSPADISASLGKSLYSYIQSLQGVSEGSPTYTSRISAIVASLKSHYVHLGLSGQQAALSKVPSNLIAQVLAAL